MLQIIGVIWFYKYNIKIIHKIVLFAQDFLIYEKYFEINNAIAEQFFLSKTSKDIPISSLQLVPHILQSNLLCFDAYTITIEEITCTFR